MIPDTHLPASDYILCFVKGQSLVLCAAFVGSPLVRLDSIRLNSIKNPLQRRLEQGEINEPMVNPGAFQGSRKEFLMQQREYYMTALSDGNVADALANVYRHYFKRYPVDLEHTEEPTAEFLSQVNDEAPDPEQELPNEEELEPQEFENAMRVLSERTELIKKRKKQIRGWLHYQYMKEHEVNDSHPDNPYRILLTQLNGQGTPRPRLPVTRNETRRRAEQDKIPTKNLAPVREKVAKEMFDALSTPEKAKWEQKAKTDHAAALKKWEDEIKAGPPIAPESRQQCIQALATFVQPILDGIATYTGWKVTILAGGPEPAHKGRLTMLSVHSGTTKGDVKMNFGRSEHVDYTPKVCGTFGNFLRKCYSPEDCRAAAYETGLDFAGLLDQALESGEAFSFDASDTSSQHTLSPSAQDVSQSEQLRVESNDGHEVTPPASIIPSTLPPLSIPPVDQPLSQQPSPIPTPVPSRQPSPAEPSLPAIHGPPSQPPSPVPTPVPSRQPSPARPSLPAIHGPPSQPPSPIPTAVPSHEPSPSLTQHLSQPPSLLPTLAHSLGSSPPNPLPTNSASQASLIIQGVIASKDAALVAVPSQVIPAKRPATQDASEGVQERTPAAKRAKASNGKDSNKDSGEQAAASLIRSTRVRKPSSRVSGNLPTTVNNPIPPQGRASTSTSSVPPIPSDSAPTPSTPPKPAWFIQSLRMFESKKLGGSWEELVGAWALFEEKGDYTEVGKVPTTHRPAAIAGWIASRRSPTYRPQNINAKEFSKEFQMWWTAMQPEWRLEDGEIITGLVDGDLEVLRRPGVNGMQSVMACLLFWGTIAKRGVARTSFLKQVEDVCAVLTALSA
ncbi:hypothetical protein CPB83DRAFT_899762 [Crepidotus variabilis]|uniref:Uncharacterized protein n=1 Tax=Crepidotus variabilis TaxID=179855 RepID=A0A9P6E4E2_9AGAR|nr:hypothetical protein CPB83DRAFT_899762 [Crepidotus variabilis]